MKNITVSVHDETYRQARIWAAENNTSVSAAVEYMVDDLARHPPRAQAAARPAPATIASAYRRLFSPI